MNKREYRPKASPWLFVVVAAAVVSACSSGPERLARPTALQQVKPTESAVRYARLQATQVVTSSKQQVRPIANLPKPLLANIITPKKPLQCVPYARDLSNIEIRGNAWTWWGQAAGRYPRSQHPRAGAVMVLKRKQNSLGHVAYVEEVIDNRTALVSHANWLNKGRIHRMAPVIDVSENNDWSAVRFWNTEGGHFGGNTYYPYGFIHRNVAVASR